MSVLQSLKKRSKNKRNLNKNNNVMGIGQESEIETLQNALQEAMLREKQLIQEKAQREDEMKQQRDASKQYIAVLMKDKQELIDKIGSETIEKMKKLEIECEENKKDLQRVLLKLAQREHEHNQFEEERLTLKRSLNEKEKDVIKYRDKHRIAADKLETMQQKIEKAKSDSEHFHETQTLLTSITCELKAAKQKNKIIENEKENLKDELTNKKAQIMELNQDVSTSKNQNTKYSETIHELRTKLEDFTTKGKQQINELLENNEQLTTDNKTLNDTINELKTEQSIANNEYIENEKKLENEISELKDENIAIQNELKTEIENKNTTIHEMEIDNKIREKKKHKLVRELQDQLKKEVIKSQELKCKVLKLNDELIGKQNNINDANYNMYDNQQLQVSNALAKKLESERKASLDLKEQIKYLTECIQQLHMDIDTKNIIIANIIKRIDIGAIPSVKIPPKNDKKHIIIELEKLKLLAQETTLQNAMLRKDLKLMGNELHESHNKIKTLQNSNSPQTK